MFLVIVGAVLAGCIGLAVLYDRVARRRGRNESFDRPNEVWGSSTTARSEHDWPQ
jgi:hypothetical protein